MMVDETISADALATPTKRVKKAAEMIETKVKSAKSGTSTTMAKVKETASEFANEAAAAARSAANEGKDKATEALETLSKVVDNAANLVDDQAGPAFGHYARKAAASVSDLAKGLQSKDIDALVDDTRNFVRKSPILAIGAAAAIGFALTRIAKIGGRDSDSDA